MASKRAGVVQKDINTRQCYSLQAVFSLSHQRGPTTLVSWLGRSLCPGVYLPRTRLQHLSRRPEITSQIAIAEAIAQHRT